MLNGTGLVSVKGGDAIKHSLGGAGSGGRVRIYLLKWFNSEFLNQFVYYSDDFIMFENT